MPARKVSCPSCGANVDIPPSLTRAHCVYCGSEILIAPEAEALRAARGDDVRASLELLNTAVNARNFSEVWRFADSVLQREPNSSYAWYCKGLATWNLYLSTEGPDRFEEGRTYLDKALEIDPGNEDARALRDAWPRSYAYHLYKLSREQWKPADQLWQRKGGSLSELLVVMDRAAPHVATALATLDKALSLLSHTRPDQDRDQLESDFLLTKIEFFRHGVTGTRFIEDRKHIRRRLEELRAKARIWEDVDHLPLFRERLEESETKIATTDKQGGFFARRRLGNLRKLRDECVQRIREAEELLGSEGSPSTTKEDTKASS